MLQAFDLSPEYNESVMFEDKNFRRCSNCKLKIDNSLNLEMKLYIKKYDFSITYDFYSIVSNKFKEFCDKENLNNLIFTPLKLYSDFWIFSSTNIVEFDTKKRETQLINFCPECNQYKEVIGSHPVVLKDRKVIQQGIYRTDIVFGSNYNKRPLLIAGVETAIKMKAMKFTGVFFEEVRYVEKLIKEEKTKKTWFKRFNI